MRLSTISFPVPVQIAEEFRHWRGSIKGPTDNAGMLACLMSTFDGFCGKGGLWFWRESMRRSADELLADPATSYHLTEGSVQLTEQAAKLVAMTMEDDPAATQLKREAADHLANAIQTLHLLMVRRSKLNHERRQEAV